MPKTPPRRSRRPAPRLALLVMAPAALAALLVPLLVAVHTAPAAEPAGEPSGEPDEQLFTVAVAHSQVVRFEEGPAIGDPNGPIYVTGYNADDKRVYVQGPDYTRGFRYENGREVEWVDEYGNGAVTEWVDHRYKTIHHRNHAGDWVQRSWGAEGGGTVVEAVHRDEVDLSDKLALLGIDPGLPSPPAVYRWVKEEDGTTAIVEGTFARTSQWVPDGYDPAGPPGVTMIQTTEALGLAMTITSEKEEVRTDEGLDTRYVHRDDRGGWQMKRYDGEGRLYEIVDEHGPIIRYKRLADGRPDAVFIGHGAMLRYHYDPPGSDFDQPGWEAKEVIDLRDGESVYTLEGKWAPLPEEVRLRPRVGTKAGPPGDDPVVEWDEQLWPDGMMIASIGHMPYALIPLDGEGPIWRSVTLSAPWPLNFVHDRIDYTDTTVILHLVMPPGSPDGNERSIAFVFERFPQTDPPATGGLPTPTDISFCNLGCLCITYESAGGTYIDMECVIGDTDCYEVPGGTGPGGPDDDDEDRDRRWDLNDGQEDKLEAAKPIALGKLNENSQNYVPECDGLFGSLPLRRRGAFYTLSQLIVFRNGLLAPKCQTGAVAFTVVGSRYVYLCPNFAHLSTREAAVRLIHEALHTAGKKEFPSPGAMTPSEIDQLVRENCELE